jgi:hypothetical protein
VNVELTEAATGVHVWSETHDAELKDICRAGRHRATRRRCSRCEAHPVRAERILTKPTENLAAHEYVLRRREFLSHASREKNDEAAALFQPAIDLDPK